MIISHAYGALGVRVRRFRLKREGMPDVSFINDNLALGGVSDIENLARIGIRCVLDLRKEAQDDLEKIQVHSMNYLRMEVNDRGVPSINQAVEAIKWIKSHTANNKVFIHCNLGRGRAPTVAVLYLIHEGMRSEEAIKTIKKVRKYSYFNKTQLKMITDFENKLNEKI